MILIDEQLTEQGLRYPVYGWVEKDGYYAKFEEFLGDYKDFSKFPGSFEDGNIRDEVIKRLATLHGGGKLFVLSVKQDSTGRELGRLTRHFRDNRNEFE